MRGSLIRKGWCFAIIIFFIIPSISSICADQKVTTIVDDNLSSNSQHQEWEKIGEIDITWKT